MQPDTTNEKVIKIKHEFKAKVIYGLGTCFIICASVVAIVAILTNNP